MSKLVGLDLRAGRSAEVILERKDGRRYQRKPRAGEIERMALAGKLRALADEIAEYLEEVEK